MNEWVPSCMWDEDSLTKSSHEQDNKNIHPFLLYVLYTAYPPSTPGGLCISPRLQSPGRGAGAEGGGEGEAGTKTAACCWGPGAALLPFLCLFGKARHMLCELGSYLQEVCLFAEGLSLGPMALPLCAGLYWLKNLISHLSSTSSVSWIQYTNAQARNMWYLYFSKRVSLGSPLIPNAEIPSLSEKLGYVTWGQPLMQDAKPYRCMSSGQVCPLRQFPLSFPELRPSSGPLHLLYLLICPSFSCRPQLPLAA